MCNETEDTHFLKTLPAFQSSWACSHLSHHRWTDSLPCPSMTFLQFNREHRMVKTDRLKIKIEKSTIKKPPHSLPLNIIFCEFCGTPVALVRASDRSLTVGRWASSWPVRVMLCFVDPKLGNQNYKWKPLNRALYSAFSTHLNIWHLHKMLESVLYRLKAPMNGVSCELIAM